jgi:exopolysaccharide biosynthesis polyprenyl glycosylphosphotransferase
MHRFVRGSMVPLLLGDFLVFSGSLVLTLLVRYQTFPNETVIAQHLQPFSFLFGIWALVFLIAGLYDRHISFARKSVPALVAKVQSVNILIAALFFFILPFGIEPKTNLVIYLIISTTLIALWRLYLYPVITASKPTRALIVGDSVEAQAIARVFSTNQYFKHIRPYLLARADIPDFEEYRAALRRFVAGGKTDMIIADMRDSYAAQLVRDFYTFSFQDSNIRFFNLPAMYEALHHRIPPFLVGEHWILENVSTDAPHYAYDVLKRGIDVVGALLLLIPTLAVFPFIMLAIMLEDRGPFFYRADRVGQHNRTIRILKFRTMTGRDDPQNALRSTLRVTRVGMVLRKTRLDELPQLLNVLAGDLSFIGPRPEIPTLAEVYAADIPYYNLRHLVKPGLSGWAQINNFDVPRGGVDVPRTIDKLSYDLYYLKHRSLFLDIEIALKTINTLLMRTGT